MDIYVCMYMYIYCAYIVYACMCVYRYRSIGWPIGSIMVISYVSSASHFLVIACHIYSMKARTKFVESKFIFFGDCNFTEVSIISSNILAPNRPRTFICTTINRFTSRFKMGPLASIFKSSIWVSKCARYALQFCTLPLLFCILPHPTCTQQISSHLHSTVSWNSKSIWFSDTVAQDLGTCHAMTTLFLSQIWPNHSGS